MDYTTTDSVLKGNINAYAGLRNADTLHDTILYCTAMTKYLLTICLGGIVALIPVRMPHVTPDCTVLYHMMPVSLHAIGVLL